MKRTNQPNRSRKVTIRFSEKEYDLLLTRSKKSTCRKLSEFLRNHLNNEPITLWHRNESADDFLDIAIGLKNELNAIGNNFNQLVRKIHLLKDSKGLNGALDHIEANLFSFQQKADEIKSAMNQIYQAWLQK